MKSSVALICLLFAISINSFTIAKAQVNVQDSLALVDLYNSTNGANWYTNTNWLTKAPVSTWAGVGITGNRIGLINLSGNNLRGHLSPSLGNLSKLYFLNLSDNHIGDSIPTFIGKLVNLTDLELSRDHFSGAIPASIGNLVKLNILYLEYNKLTGELPATIGNLVNLQKLFLYKNQLTGSLPSTIGNLRKLTDLWVEFNKLSGRFPASIVKLTNLVNLFANNNELSGLPVEIGNLTNLRELNMAHNQLSDTLPSTIGNLSNLFNLDLSFNHLSGAIPSFLANPPLLYTLYLNNNNFSGSVPHSFARSNLTNLYLNHNQLSQNNNIDYKFTPRNLANLYVSHNLFTFDGLELVAQLQCFTSYSTQAPIPIHQHKDTLAVYAGGTLSNNTYSWFKVGQAGQIVIKGDSTFAPATGGKYYAKITNSIADQLILRTDTIDFIISHSIADNRVAADVNSYKPEGSLQVSPNPARDYVVINGLLINEKTTIVISDAIGNTLVTQTTRGAASYKCDISRLAAGVYYVQVQTIHSNKTLKFIKE